MGNRSDEISKIVTRAIISKDLLPGCKLSEQTLADLFDVSRAVVRQALIRLSDDGLVTMERNKGAFVSRPSFREAVEIYDALTMLEQGVAAQLSGRLDARGWSELRQHVERQNKAVEDKNDELADQLGSGFHEVLVRLSRNTVVQQMHAQLIRRTALLRSLVSSRFDYCGLLHDHEVLVDLLEEGKVTEAQKLIATHHNDVVKGYLMDDTSQLEINAREALERYVSKQNAA
ncbi:GntR family transcriptional regulator [Rhodobacteraceae bacterium B1Z28]|uniref:GntR family transcriptional regulator n=1 Tax=Ruegeria haliotis TaxID=2747601 RepID=A0ABX2PWH5_9RHOB|nr:GntR family transcriptional regulator [Ruegeria haliotis]NVO58555.1 GntR family transcriptional regulator [Ruegeria haliotis]